MMDLPGFDPGTSRMSVSTTISPNEHTVVDRSPKLLIGLFLLKYAKRALLFREAQSTFCQFRHVSMAVNYSRAVHDRRSMIHDDRDDSPLPIELQTP